LGHATDNSSHGDLTVDPTGGPDRFVTITYTDVCRNGAVACYFASPLPNGFEQGTWDDLGAMPAGNWSGCHAVGWDMNAPEFGDLAVGDNFQKHSYPFGIMVNANGERFVDEGADFRNYTYAKYGREVLAQPGHFAWQIFDSKVLHLLRDEYRIRQVTKVTADTLEALTQRLDDVEPAAALATIEAFNAAVRTDIDRLGFNT